MMLYESLQRLHRLLEQNGYSVGDHDDDNDGGHEHDFARNGTLTIECFFLLAGTIQSMPL